MKHRDLLDDKLVRDVLMPKFEMLGLGKVLKVSFDCYFEFSDYVIEEGVGIEISGNSQKSEENSQEENFLHPKNCLQQKKRSHEFLAGTQHQPDAGENSRES